MSRRNQDMNLLTLLKVDWLSREVAVVLLVKLLAIVLLWWFFFDLLYRSLSLNQSRQFGEIRLYCFAQGGLV